jgi:multidrug resistance efflux pump
MKINRVVAAAVVVGVTVAAISFLSAAKMSGEDKSGADGSKSGASGKNGSPGKVVVFGHVSGDNGPGYIPIFPEGFPQPCLVKKVLAKEGQEVAVDTPLIEFDSELADLKVKEARAGLERAKSAQNRYASLLEQAVMAEKAQPKAIEVQQTILNGKQKEVDAAETAWKEAKRQLGEIGVDKDPKVIEAKQKMEGAQEQLNAEKLKLDMLKTFDIVSKKRKEAEAGAAEAKAAVDIQEGMLDEALLGKRMMTLKSRTAGKIVRCMVSDGMTFGPQTKQPAFLLQTNDPIVIRAEVDQEWASRVAAGQNADIYDDGDSNLKWKGKVVRVADIFLPKRVSSSVPEGLALNETLVLECIISVDQVDKSFPLRIGQRVKVNIRGDE